MSIIDAADLDDGSELRSAVAIIGGGAAGIAVALRLAARGVDSVVCESGTDDRDERTQDLYVGESNGYWDLTATRLRYFGGSTNHFNGQSRPLGVVDFEPASWRPGHAWPIAHTQLMRHVPDAMDLLGLAPGSWDIDDWFDDLPVTTVAGTLGFEPLMFQARAASMGATHRQTLAASGRCTVVFGVNATSVVLDDAATRVDGIELVTLSGSQLTVVADAYVVATGGIESARLLLASDQQVVGGVGNSSGLVGRYFADHPATPALRLVRSPWSSWSLPERQVPGPFGDAMALARIGISDDTQARLGVPGFHLRTWSYPESSQASGQGASGEGASTQGASGEGASAQGASGLSDGAVAGAGVAALLDPLGPPPDMATMVSIGFDPSPNRNSRVVLSDVVRNELGERAAEIQWRFTSDDEANMAAVVELVARQFAMLGVGRLDTNPPAGTWAESVEGQHHHMGTLRMSASASAGVVDTDLRLHDVANLYAAGSAVFPTYGHVNPTLNIVALSLRLGDHLADRVV